MNLKSKIAAGLGVLALGVALAGPAYAGVSPEVANGPLTTTDSIISFEGGGNYLTACASVGATVSFVYTPSGCDVTSWDFNIQSNGQYYLHPHGHSTLCLTYDTSNNSVALLVETCVAKYNQYFEDPKSGSYYHLYNTSDDGGSYVFDDGPIGDTAPAVMLDYNYGYGSTGAAGAESFQQ